MGVSRCKGEAFKQGLKATIHGFFAVLPFNRVVGDASDRVRGQFLDGICALMEAFAAAELPENGGTNQALYGQSPTQGQVGQVSQNLNDSALVHQPKEPKLSSEVDRAQPAVGRRIEGGFLG